MKTLIVFVSFFYYASGNTQNSFKHYFFDFQQDSWRTRTLNAAAPAAMQSFSINNSLITDYIGNTRVSLLTGMIASKKDTMLALHSLANGAGNLTLEAELPLWCKPMRRKRLRDFVGLSFHPRVSTIVTTTQTFETGMISYDLGFNISGKLSGDLGNISLKYSIRNAVCSGNNRFVQAAFQFTENHFYYNAIILRLKSGPNIFSFTKPTFIYSGNNEMVDRLPVYIGYSLLF